MEFQFIAGPGHSGKTVRLQEQIIETTMKEPGQRIIYIVPEQSTLTVQRDLLNRHPRHGILNVEILSFNRLAHRILQETGDDRYQTLDDMGKSMLLYKTALDHEEELLYYRSSIRRPGFIGQLKIMMTEMYQYRMDATVLEKIIEKLPPDSTLSMKLHDICILYKSYDARTQEETIPSEKLLDRLCEQIPKSRLLEQVDLYIDDFYGFTPQQYEVLKALMTRARRVCMTLKITEAALKQYRPGMDVRDLKGSLFYQPLKTLARMTEMGVHGRIRLLKSPYNHKELRYVAENLWTAATVTPVKAERIRLHKADRPENEIEWVLAKIASLVRSQGYQYQDITILVGAIEGYQHTLLRMADRYQIPLFIDQGSGLDDNPVVQMLLAALRMALYGYNYETVFDFVKTGFLPFPREEMDRMENRALAEGWRGASKYKEGFLLMSGENEELKAWTEALFAGLAALGKGQKTVSEHTEALRRFMDLGHVQEQLEKRAGWYAEHQQPLMENVYRQVYEGIQSVLDQLTAVLGSEKVTLRQYMEILQVGIQQCRLGVLPPAPDQVNVADMNRSRIGAVKALFVVGFQDENFPAITEEAGLLTDAERRKSAAYHDMASDQSLRMLEQEFFLYTALSKAQDSIWFSWSTGDGQGRSKRPSKYVARLEKMFLRDGLYDNRIQRSAHPNWLLDAYADGRYQGKEAETVRRWLAGNGYEDIMERLQQAPEDTAPMEKLEQGELWELLELSRRPVSVTQLEQYASCPFAYFLRYGLGLREREMLDVRPLDDGNVLHAILENAGEYLQSVIELPPDTVEETMARLMDERSEEFSRYQASNRYQFYWSKLKKTAVRAVKILQEQIQSGEFRPEAFEWTFGGGQADAPALTIPLKNGRRLHLMGKIDRIDVLNEDDERYVRILDYKTGTTDWNAWDVHAGLKLQLPIYLDAYQSSRQAQPAGIFYFHLTPVLQKAEAEQDEEDRHRQVLRSARLDGLLLDNVEIAEKMDAGLREGASVIIPAQVKRDGTFYSTASVASAEQFEQLRKYTRSKAAELAESIVDGRMEPAPVFKEQTGTTVCEYCEYRSACRLDPRQDQHRYRHVNRRSQEAFWEFLANEEDETEAESRTE